MSNFPTVRLRRLRQNDKLRALVRETHLNVDQLVYPMFVAEGITEPREISAMRVSVNIPVMVTAASSITGMSRTMSRLSC